MKLYKTLIKLNTPKLVLYDSSVSGRYVCNLTTAMDKHSISPNYRMVTLNSTISRDNLNDGRLLIWNSGRVRGVIEVDELNIITEINILNSSIGTCFLPSVKMRTFSFIGKMIEYYGRKGV